MKKSNLVKAMLWVLCLIVVLSSCAKGKTTNNNVSNSSEKINTIILEELQSNGEIGYDKLCFMSLKSFQNNDFAKYFDSGYLPFRYNSKIGYCDKFGNVLISEKYDSATAFSESKAFVKTNGCWKIIDSKGKELYTLPDEYQTYQYDDSDLYFQNDTAIVTAKKQTAYMGIIGSCYDLKALIIKNNMETSELTLNGGLKLTHKTINTPEFQGILISYLQKDTSADVYNTVFSLYDINGTKIWESIVPDGMNAGKELFDGLGSNSVFQYEGFCSIDAFIAQNGYINIVNSNKKWGLLNLANKTIAIDCNYDYVGGYSEDAIPVCNYGKWGYINLNNDIVIKPQYKYGTSFAYGAAIVIDENNKCMLINKQQSDDITYNFRLDDDINYIFPLSDKSGLWVIRSGRDLKHIIIVDNHGEVLVSLSDASRFYCYNKVISVDNKVYEIKYN